MKSKMHKSQVLNYFNTILYFRNPTREEIKFGYGAIHYRDFDFHECFDSGGFFRNVIIAKNDGMKYQYQNFKK